MGRTQHESSSKHKYNVEKSIRSIQQEQKKHDQESKAARAALNQIDRELGVKGDKSTKKKLPITNKSEGKTDQDNSEQLEEIKEPIPSEWKIVDTSNTTENTDDNPITQSQPPPVSESQSQKPFLTSKIASTKREQTHDPHNKNFQLKEREYKRPLEIPTDLGDGSVKQEQGINANDDTTPPKSTMFKKRKIKNTKPSS